MTRHVSSFSRGSNGGVRVARGSGTGSVGSGGKPGGHHGGSGGGGTGNGNGSGSGNGWNNWGNGSYGIGWGLVSSLLNSFGGYGYGGYGGYGYGGYGGYGSYGCGYGYNQYCSYGGNGFGGYASPGYYTYASPGYPLVATNLVTTDASGLAQPATVAVDNTTPTATTAISYADNGETAFKSGDFKGAEYAMRHAVVDDPKNPVLVMMLSQALFATGKYDESAGAAQNAMQQLVKEQWGVVVTNYKDLYTSNQSYTDQLRALEKAVQDKPDSPALHFLLGFQYGYLGYPQNAVDHLNKTIKLAPRDEMAKQLLNEMQAKLPKPAASVGT
ncbi:MAG: hypothetical protein JWN70_4736 [Planctomycetaceae bacterium]|nr:hypothetical protein [Planctomycetaceae bacterium]